MTIKFKEFVKGKQVLTLDETQVLELNAMVQESSQSIAFRLREIYHNLRKKRGDDFIIQTPRIEHETIKSESPRHSKISSIYNPMSLVSPKGPKIPQQSEKT